MRRWNYTSGVGDEGITQSCSFYINIAVLLSLMSLHLDLLSEEIIANYCPTFCQLPMYLITRVGGSWARGSQWRLWLCLCVCLTVSALKGKRLELSIPISVDVQYMTVARHALTRRSKGQRWFRVRMGERRGYERRYDCCRFSQLLAASLLSSERKRLMLRYIRLDHMCVCVCVRKVYCGKTADWIRMPFGVVSGSGLVWVYYIGVVIVEGKGQFWGVNVTNGDFATRLFSNYFEDLLLV